MSLSDSNSRHSMLIDWLHNQLRLDFNRLEAASSDASFRKYFRVTGNNGSLIVMDAPPDKEKLEPFIQVAKLFKSVELHVPDIYQINLQQGFLLLEDLGSTNLLDALTPNNAELFYQQALSSLFKLQTGINTEDCQLPAYDFELLQRELIIFEEWFLEKLLNITMPVSIRNHLHVFLIDSALAQPQVCVHRDYHSRNLMVLDRQELGIIDFQDAVIGPISYDLASLLRDCYIEWPDAQVQHWLQNYYRKLQNAKLSTVDFEQFQYWFDLIGLQRHLKAIGIFSRLHLRDNKPAYLADIPRTMNYVSNVSARYPELAEFSGFLKHQVLPVYKAAL